MKKYLLLILSITVFLSCVTSLNVNKRPGSKANPFKDKYTDQLEPGSQIIQSWYHYSIEKTTAGDYIYKQYYPSTKQILELITYNDKDLSTQNGLYKKWTHEGLMMEEGHYKNDERTGEWKKYNFFEGDGSLSSYGPYKSGKKEGLWTSVDDLQRKTEEFTYNDNVKNGPYKLFTEKGELAEEGIYSNGEIQSRTEHIKLEKSSSQYTVVEVMPSMKSCENEPEDKVKTCSDKTMLMAIYKSVRYPAIAREMGIEGINVVTFVIDKDGSVKDIRMLRALCEEMGKECMRVVKKLPAWNPGTQNGEAVKVQFNLPVKFRLE